MNFAAIYYFNVAGAIFGWIGDIFSTLNQVFYNMVETLLKMLETLITKTPYPQDGSGNPKFFGQPSGDMWGPMYEMYQTTSDLTLIILMILLVVVAGVRIFDDYIPSYAQSNQAGEIVKMMFATVLWWPVGVAMLMLSDLLAQAVLTLSTSTEINGTTTDGLHAAFLSIKNHPDMGFTSGGGGVEGIVLSLALLIPFVLQTGVMLILVFLWIIRYMTIYLLMPVMPLMFALMAFNLPGADDLQDVAKSTVETYISLVFLTFPAAVIVVVFGRMSSKMVGMIDSIITGSGASSATMTLADGAAATGDVAGIVSSVTTLILGIAFMAALPLIAAGGPFILIAGGNEGIRDAAMGTALGGIGGKVLSGGSAVGSFGSELLGESSSRELPEGEAGEIPSESGGSDAGGEVEGDAGTSANEAERGRFGKMKQKMSSSITTASNLKDRAQDWDDQSLAQKTKTIGGGAATASAMMGSKVKGEADFMRRKGVTGYARNKSGNAKNKVGNALTKGRVGAGDGMSDLKNRTDNVTGAIEENLNNSRDKLSRIKENPRSELSQTASQAGSAIMNSYRKKDFDQMSKKEKEELMTEMGLHEEWKEGDKTAEELYMQGRTTERRTTQDVMEERARENKERREQISDQIQSRLKAAGAWDDYMSGMSAEDALKANIDGQEMKVEDLANSKEEAEELGFDPEEYEARAGQVDLSTDTEYSRNATVQDFFDKHNEDLPFDNARELKGWLDDHGWDVDVTSLNHSVVQEQLNQLGGNLDEGRDYLSDIADENGKVRSSSPNSRPDEIDGKTREGYTQKYTPEEIAEHARKSGYVDDNGNVKTNEYLQQEIDQKERKGGDNTVNRGEWNDAMASVWDDVERAEGQYTEDIAQEVSELEKDLEETNRDLSRAGKHIEGEDLTDTNMSQDERKEILSGDVSGPDSSTVREEIKDETMPNDTGSGNRNFTDVPNEAPGESGTDTKDTQIDSNGSTKKERESAAAEAVGDMFSS